MSESNQRRSSGRLAGSRTRRNRSWLVPLSSSTTTRKSTGAESIHHAASSMPMLSRSRARAGTASGSVASERSRKRRRGMGAQQKASILVSAPTGTVAPATSTSLRPAGLAVAAGPGAGAAELASAVPRRPAPSIAARPVRALVTSAVCWATDRPSAAGSRAAPPASCGGIDAEQGRASPGPSLARQRGGVGSGRRQRGARLAGEEHVVAVQQPRVHLPRRITPGSSIRTTVSSCGGSGGGAWLQPASAASATRTHPAVRRGLDRMTAGCRRAGARGGSAHRASASCPDDDGDARAS